MTQPHYDRPHGPPGWVTEETAIRQPVTPAHRRVDPGDAYPQDAYLHTAPIVTGPPDPYQLDEAETLRMTVTDRPEPLRDPLQPQPMDPSTYDDLKAEFEASAGRPALFLHELSPPELISDPNTPPWRGIDTFLRRGVMAGAFVVLWTMIVVGVLAGAAIVNAVNNLGDTSTVEQTELPPGTELFPDCDPTGSNPDLPAC